MKHLVIITLIAALGLMATHAALALSPVPAPDAPDYSAEQQAQIGKIAAAYLLAHPEILAQMKNTLRTDKTVASAPACTPVKGPVPLK